MDEPIDNSRRDQALPRRDEPPAQGDSLISAPMVTTVSPELVARLAACLSPQPGPQAGREQPGNATPPVAAVGSQTDDAIAVAGLGSPVTAAHWSPQVNALALPPSAAVVLATAETLPDPAAVDDWTTGLGDLLDADPPAVSAPSTAAAHATTVEVSAPRPDSTAPAILEATVPDKGAPADEAAPGTVAPERGPAGVVDGAGDLPSKIGSGETAAAPAQSPFALRPRDVMWTPEAPPFKSPADAPAAARMATNPTIVSAVAAAPEADHAVRDRQPTRTGRGAGLPALLRKTVRFAAIALLVWFGAMLAAIAVFRFVDPPGSMLMLSQWVTGTSIDQRWVRLRDISPNVVRAVIVSEDGRFCTHWGIDPQEVADAVARARDGVPRGASTITMQVAKNLFLWPSKSYVRKALELPLTLSIEALWSKSRILEVYLNIAEWGPGVFGVEAAARHHFAKGAAKLSEQEAALLAVALPNPIQRDAGDPGIGTLRLARAIQARMRSAGRAASCIVRSR